MILNKEAFLTSQRMLESPQSDTSSSHLGLLNFDGELVVVVPHGIHQGSI